MKKLLFLMLIVFMAMIAACASPEEGLASDNAPYVLGMLQDSVEDDIDVVEMSYNSYVIFTMVDFEENYVDYVLYDVTFEENDTTKYATILYTYDSLEGLDVQVYVNENLGDHEAVFTELEENLSESTIAEEVQERAGDEVFDYTHDMVTDTFTEEEIETFMDEIS